ncbi:hypothetical protein IWW34DRAFT_761644 [Fusarium oxysporum f. sp. albedinis]|nr:hypothetical protein IWW34DRAFT_761644 [Fusarium oxysporum f. sp. albedinis]
MSLTIYVISGALLVLLARRIYVALLGPLKNVPGPFLAKFTRLWELKCLRDRDFERKLVKLHQQYGRAET